jgi:MFS family permease
MDVVKSSGVVFVVLLLSGTVISLIAGRLLCSKTGVGSSFYQGSMYALLPTLTYAVARYFQRIRGPFVRTLEGFGMSTDAATTVGIGYLVMMAGWISVIWNVHRTEKAVCNPDAAEMTEFRQALTAKLARDEIAREKNAEKK